MKPPSRIRKNHACCLAIKQIDTEFALSRRLRQELFRLLCGELIGCEVLGNRRALFVALDERALPRVAILTAGAGMDEKPVEALLARIEASED